MALRFALMDLKNCPDRGLNMILDLGHDESSSPENIQCRRWISIENQNLQI